MVLKHLAAFVMLLAIPQAPVQASAQNPNHPAQSAPAAKQPASSAPVTSPSATPMTSQTAATDCLNGPCNEQPSHITIATPAPAPAPWPVQDRILWGADVLLALVGYAGIMLALSLLKKIERQWKYVETAATAAGESAQAALLQSQFIRHSERPWVLVTVAPSPSVENGFTVIATNRGRSPAWVVGISNELKIAVDGSQLPGIPEYSPVDSELPPVSVILLPGETTSIKFFCRDDVKEVCGSEETLHKIEDWGERIFLYGKVLYRDLMAPTDEPAHETGWCCRYIHGRQKSGLVMAGTQEYNVHT